ncbi:hypothetical protein [Polaribacter sp.]|uniref:hypothetical protein n=1 Tax=Polaribacter sp. TaxID=1920175 RepID=UPI003F6AA9DD
MGENKHIEELDAFAKKYVKEITPEKTSTEFTKNVLNIILEEEKKAIYKPTPIISKKIWLLAAFFIAICCFFLFKVNSTKTIKFPELDFSFFNNLTNYNVLENISISSSIMYAVVIFSVLALIQIGFLKNYLSKQFE